MPNLSQQVQARIGDESTKWVEWEKPAWLSTLLERCKEYLINLDYNPGWSACGYVPCAEGTVFEEVFNHPSPEAALCAWIIAYVPVKEAKEEPVSKTTEATRAWVPLHGTSKIPVEANEAVPIGEIWLVDERGPNPKVVGKIVNLAPVYETMAHRDTGAGFVSFLPATATYRGVRGPERRVILWGSEDWPHPVRRARDRDRRQAPSPEPRRYPDMFASLSPEAEVEAMARRIPVVLGWSPAGRMDLARQLYAAGLGVRKV